MNAVRWLKIIGALLIVLGLFKPVHSLAQGIPFPVDPYLDSWSFYDPTNWLSDKGYAPIAFTNIVCDESCWSSDDGILNCNGLILDSTNAAVLNYKVVESDGNTNLICSAGTIWFWFSPSWGSTNLGDGSTGPGDWGRFVDVGVWTSNADYGWWSLYVDPAGDNIYFSGQTNGMETNYFTVPISWPANSWHLIGLIYSATNSALYVDGQLATNGLGVSYWPGHDVLTNGFYIGSDFSGTEQAHGEFVDIEFYSDTAEWGDSYFSDYYNWMLPELPGSGGFTMDGPSLPSFPDGGGGAYSPDYGALTNADYGTNLWLWISGVSSNLANLALINTSPDILYEIQSLTNLSQFNWASQGFVYGSELTNWTPSSDLAVSKQGNLFLRIRSWQDSTGSGIPDWWWLTYFGQVTNVNPNASAAGDGYSNLQKFQLGLNPTNYYNPNPPGGFFGCLDASGTNAFIEWSNAPGPVINYSIQRGILNTNTGLFVYSQIGLVSSNATFFEDVGTITNANAQNNIYNLEAVYPGGSLSATDTWDVWWYPNDGSYGPPYGPPMLGSFYAYADSTGTNVLLSWTPAQGAATNYIILRGIYNSTNSAWNYIQITNVSASTTNFEIFGAITNSSNWTDVYEATAVYPGGGLSFPATTMPNFYSSSSSINVGANTNGPAAPGNFYGYPDATGTNIFLTWTPVSGSVTNYILYAGVLDPTTYLIIYHQIGKVNSTTNSFKVVGAIDGSGNNLNYIYNVVAVYTNRSLSQSAAWNPTTGAPAPGTLSAYVDSTGTNVVLAWTAALGTVTGYILQVSDYYGDGGSYYQLTNVSSATFSFKDVDGVDNAYNGLDAVVYEVQATYANGGLSPAITATVATNVPAPSNLSATVDSTGTNVFLAWSPAVGVVTGYTVLRGTYNSSTGNYSYSTIATVGSGTTSFEDVGANTGGNANNDIYQVEADYAGGSFSSPVSSTITQSSTPPTYNLNVTARMVRNQTGHWQLMFSSIPATVQKIAFYWYFCSYFDDFGNYPDPTDFTSNGQPLTTENDIPVSSITNGVYVLPDFLMTNWFPNNELGKVGMIQPIGTNNQYGVVSQVGFQPYDSPTFVDGRQTMKQNLLFKLRGATISQPVGLSEGNIWWDPFWISYSIPTDTNYVESSFFHTSWQAKTYAPGFGGYTYMKMDNIWPFTANYQLHGNLYDPSFSGSSFSWQPNASAAFPASVVFQGTLATVPATAVLGVSDPYWISQGLGNLSDVGAYESGNSLYLQSGSHNLFGLSFAAALVNEGGVDYNVYPFQTYPPITLSPGGSVTVSNADSFFNPNVFFSQTADPSLQLASYYFAPVNTPGTAMPGVYPAQLYPLPSDTGFASTNQTGVMITSVGTPTVIGGWAKFSILNGSSSKFAYLGQYYVTNAFVVTNGIVTTNKTGVVSPYGDFFPTQPGAVAMITMPDIDTGAQGTGVVRVVSLNVDANHDGTMNFAYNSPDFVSSSKPFRFWVNDDKDWSDTTGDGVPGQGASGDGVKQIQNTWEVHGRRDLVDFFPVCLNIGSLFQSNALNAGVSITDTNYQFVLSQADGALRFAYTDLTPTNYMNFLRDTNESGSLAFAPLTTINTSGVTLTNTFVSGIATNNQNIILVEAWESTTQPLVLSVYKGSNLVAQTQLYLSMSSVEQMFRYKNLLLSPDSRAEADRLTDADVPNEPDTTNRNVVFVHGYNVNPTSARGWFADIYKRLYWSGSHAKFYGVNWEGYDSQGSIPLFNSVTPNYQTNVVRAFQTAPLLASFIATLTNGPTVAMAHSLGNMVTLSALSDYSAPISQYFMLDAAVPTEAIDGSTAINTNMVFSTTTYSWLAYSNKLWASKWFNVWPTNDARNTLTWSNRLANFGSTTVYNFYSSGEDVLRTQIGPPPGDLFSLFGQQLVQYIESKSGTFVWAWQEKLKGQMSGNSILSSDHGGWGFFGISSIYTTYSVAMANAIPPSQLQTNAFFDMSVDTAMFTTSSSGSTYAQTSRNRILSDAIPALTLPVGANYATNLDVRLGGTANFDMQTLENSWPVERGAPQYPVGTTAFGEWHHSDIRQVAYTFTYKVFSEIVNDGNLK